MTCNADSAFSGKIGECSKPRLSESELNNSQKYNLCIVIHMFTTQIINIFNIAAILKVKFHNNFCMQKNMFNQPYVTTNKLNIFLFIIKR